MAEEIRFEVGKDYITRGGWRARVIWINAQGGEQVKIDRGMYVIHKPGEADESTPIIHFGGRVSCDFAVNLPPAYGQHPADIIPPPPLKVKDGVAAIITVLPEDEIPVIIDGYWGFQTREDINKFIEEIEQARKQAFGDEK